MARGSWYEQAARWVGGGLPNLTIGLIVLQAAGFIMSRADPKIGELLYLDPWRVVNGEAWRLVTFLMAPPNAHPIWIFFALYIFYIMGTALEREWGDARYTLYLALGYVATALVTVVLGLAGVQTITTNYYLYGSVFLAFALLFPTFELNIMFVLPVQVRYLAWITWALYVLGLINGDWGTRSYIVAGVANYFAFFGPELAWRMRQGQRARRFERRARRDENEAFHRCVVCGRTDASDPELEFRYASYKGRSYGFCIDHVDRQEAWLAEHAGDGAPEKP